jgi:hypothetical protein
MRARTLKSSSRGTKGVAAVGARRGTRRALVLAILGLLLSIATVASAQDPRPAPTLGTAPAPKGAPAPAAPAPPKRQPGPIDAGTVADPNATAPGSMPPPQDGGTRRTPRQRSGSRPAATRTAAPRFEAVTDAPPVATNAARRTAGFGNAALQSQAAKMREARADCVPNRPPISAMLGVGGSVTLDERTPWGWLAIAIAVGASLFALAAFKLRQGRGGHRDEQPPRGTLETVATLVAVFGGIAGLAVQFVPGVASESPAPEAAMAVREIHSRITRGEYASKTGALVQLSNTDKREVGDVIWLEIDLRGYDGLAPQLQYGLYDPDLGGALLPGTAKQVALSNDGDMQRSFVPIWVGYPRSQRFQAQFRVLERGRVRQMTTTPKLRTSRYRYACARSA